MLYGKYMKTKKNTTTLSEQLQNQMIKIVERGKIDTSNTQIPHTYLVWYRHFNKKKWRGKTSLMGPNLPS